MLVAYSSAAKRKNREHAGNETSRPMPEDSRQVAKMEAKKFFTYLRLVFSVIFSIDLFHFIVIIMDLYIDQLDLGPSLGKFNRFALI